MHNLEVAQINKEINWNCSSTPFLSLQQHWATQKKKHMISNRKIFTAPRSEVWGPFCSKTGSKAWSLLGQSVYWGFVGKYKSYTIRTAAGEEVTTWRAFAYCHCLQSLLQYFNPSVCLVCVVLYQVQFLFSLLRGYAKEAQWVLSITLLLKGSLISSDNYISIFSH